MAKKTFKSGLDEFFKENIEEIEDINEVKTTKTPETINIEDISDEKVKWLLVKLKRYEKELHMWRTGKLNLELFQATLKKQNLVYNEETREFEKKEE